MVKKDLRIHDHEPFFEAQKFDIPIILLYVFELTIGSSPIAQ